jgi:hypothetical protein
MTRETLIVMSDDEKLLEISSRNSKLRPIFGPEWSKQNTRFLDSDDRVRGGSSQVSTTFTLTLP